MSEITIVNFNYEHGGYDWATRRHDHEPALDMIRAAGDAPDILAYPEATSFLDFHQDGLWTFVRALNRLCSSGAYYPFVAPDKRTAPALFVHSDKVTPLEWHEGGKPGTRPVLANTLRATIGGHEVWLKTEHWTGSEGPRGFDIHGARTMQLASKPAIIAGDFNMTSSAPGETVHTDWHERFADVPWKRAQKGHKVAGRWEVYTDPMDSILQNGFWDAGETAGDFRTTTGDNVRYGSHLRIDRILVSHQLSATLVPGSYRVLPTTCSDHRLVACCLRLP